MLEFRKLKTEDFEKCQPIMYKKRFRNSESSFLTLFLWSEMYGTEICIDEDAVFFRSVKDGKASYIFPYAEDERCALVKLFEHERACGNDFVKFHSLTEPMREILEREFAGEFSYTERRASFDYIYEAEALSALEGKKFHGKRGHLKKFLKKFEGRYTCRPLCEADIDDVLAFQKKWIEKANDKESRESLEYESKSVSKLFESFSYFGLLGAVLRVDGEIVAYCLAARTCEDTVEVMVEKADYSFDGAYQMINKSFAELVSDKVKYLNREDDMGLPGLRKAKLSYYPSMLIEKYSAIWKR